MIPGTCYSRMNARSALVNDDPRLSQKLSMTNDTEDGTGIMKNNREQNKPHSQQTRQHMNDLAAQLTIGRTKAQRTKKTSAINS